MKNVIFVVTHKPVRMPKDKLFIPILVGKKIFTIADAVRDDSGDNIADKNANYCELTALYWMWKNFEYAFDNIGLCHYRRYFSSSELLNNEGNYLRSEEIDKILKDADIILPQKFNFDCTIDIEYYVKGNGKKKDLDAVRLIINEQFPEYLDSFDSVLKDYSASYCNMFITKKKYFNDYCEWLFKILFLLESITDLSDYTPEEARIYGYLSEILLNVWVRKNNLRIKELPMALSDINTTKYFLSKVKKKVLRWI